jgi:GTPase SAR1 family protein
MEVHHHLVKTIIVGDVGVGKTSIMVRLASSRFDAFSEVTALYVRSKVPQSIYPAARCV